MGPIPLHVLLVEDHAPLREQVAALIVDERNSEFIDMAQVNTSQDAR